MENPIKPHRAFYLCDKKKQCSPDWPGCPNEECHHTEDVNHALNGPVVNVREWEERFDVIERDGLVYYWEKEE